MGSWCVVYTAACQVKGGVMVRGLHCRMSGERWGPGAWFTLPHVRLKVGSWCVVYTAACQVKGGILVRGLHCRMSG